MAGIITKMLKQTAIYWAPSGTDKHGGPTWGAPVELLCRWEDRSEEFLDSKGERRQSSAVVYVSADVEVRGMLKLGELTSGTGAPRAEGASEIERFDKLPDFRARQFLRTAYLSRQR